MAVILRQIEMEVGKQTFVRFRLNTSFTRIASSLDKAQSTGGFTRYFRQFKKEVEEAGTGDDYIFIFSHKELHGQPGETARSQRESHHY